MVQPGSVAAEDDKVEVGDVVTHINQESVVGASNTDKLLGLISKAKGKPILLTVTKCFDLETRELSSALLPLIKSAGIDVEDLQRSVRGRLMLSLTSSIAGDISSLNTTGRIRKSHSWKISIL